MLTRWEKERRSRRVFPELGKMFSLRENCVTFQIKKNIDERCIDRNIDIGSKIIIFVFSVMELVGQQRQVAGSSPPRCFQPLV